MSLVDSAFKPRTTSNYDLDAPGSSAPYLFPPSNPSSKKHGMFSKLLSPATLQVNVSNPLLYLRPQKPSATPDVDAPPQDDCVLSGTVTLTLLKPREIKKIIVGVRGQSDVGFPDRPYETQTVLSKDLEICLLEPGGKGSLLDKGEHTFEWSFIIPSSTAPYERGPYGRTYHKVVAKAKGAGLLGDLAAESYWEAVCNPSGDEPNGELSLDIHLEDHSPHLGAYLMTLSSRIFTVSGLLSFHLSLPSAPSALIMHHITCYITQTYRLRSSASVAPGQPPVESRPAPQRRRIFRIDGSHQPGIQGRKGHPSYPPSRAHSRVASLTREGRSGNSTPMHESPFRDRGPAERSLSGFRGRVDARERDPVHSELTVEGVARALARGTFTSTSRSRAGSPPPAQSAGNGSTSTSGGESPGRGRAGGPSRSRFLGPGAMTASSTAATSESKSQSRGRDKSRKGVTWVGASDEPLAKLSEGEGWEVRHLARLPNDDHMRPSTHPGTNTPIHVSHLLTVEVVYSVDSEVDEKAEADGKPPRKMLSLAKPVHIVSCCCMQESLVLPAYSEWDPHSEMQDPLHRNAARMFCVCGMSTEKLLKTQDPTSAETPEGDLPPGAGAPKPDSPNGDAGSSSLPLPAELASSSGTRTPSGAGPCHITRPQERLPSYGRTVSGQSAGSTSS